MDTLCLKTETHTQKQILYELEVSQDFKWQGNYIKEHEVNFFKAVLT